MFSHSFLPIVPCLPIDPPPNATLFFQKQVPGFRIDPATGNEIQNREVVAVEAFLRNERRKVNEKLSPGLMDRSIRLKGYIIDDYESIDTLDFSQVVEMTRRNNLGAETSGTFQFMETPTPFTEGIATQIGIPISGLFTVAGSGETF